MTNVRRKLNECSLRANCGEDLRDEYAIPVFPVLVRIFYVRNNARNYNNNSVELDALLGRALLWIILSC